MRTIAAILLFCLIVCVPVAVCASDITNAVYTGTIIISNNGTAATYVSTNMSLSSASMISNGYVDGDMYGAAMRTNGGSDAVFMPGYGSNSWFIYVPSISANSSLNYTLYTTSTDNLSATKYYIPGSTGMTVSDVAGLEIGNKKFNITVEGIFNTSEDAVLASIVYKPLSMYFYVTDVDEISCSMHGVASFAANVSSGNHTLEFFRETTGSGNITLEVDSVYAGSVAVGASGFADVVDDWEFLPYASSNTTAAIIRYIDFEIDGSQVGHWEWEYDTTFTDLSGNNNDGDPSFPTDSSDSDVSAVLSSFEPLNPAQAPSYTVEDAPDFITANLTATGNFSTTTLPDASFPGADVIEDVASESNTPEVWIWGIIGIVTISLGGVGISYARRNYAIGGGYVTVIIIIALLVLGFLVTFGKFDWWMIWFYIITASGLAVASRHIDLGGATSTHGMIGFLAMTWIGLTLINRILEGALLTSSETAFLNTVAFTRIFEVMGMFTIPILNFSFFTEGIPSLMRWNYTFFGGQAQIIQYMLYSITAVVSFILFGLIIGLVFSYFSRLR